jgi:hypothetical protein
MLMLDADSEPVEGLASDEDYNRSMRTGSLRLLRALESAQGRYLTPLPAKPEKTVRWSRRKPNNRLKLRPVTPGMTAKEIVKAVADAFELTPSQMVSTSRSTETVLARHVAIRLLRDRRWRNGEYRYSTVRIGKLVNRDHSSILNALQTFDAKAAKYPEVREIYDGLRWAI